MAWTSFLLGRPGNEYAFEVPPESMSISYDDVKVLQTNLAGDLKKSVLKVDVPTIQIKSSYLSLLQRNQIASLRHVTDTFLSFQCRDDWQVYYDPVTILNSTSVQIANSSATRLSAALVALGAGSTISIQSPFYLTLPSIGAGVTFNPGTITYIDEQNIVLFSNPLASLTAPLYVSYIYTGWFVEISKLTIQNQGGWVDRSTYDIELQGA